MSERGTLHAAPDTVIFDLGGVLIDWNPRYLYRQLFDDEQVMERFLTEVCHSKWNEQQDAGRPWDEAIALLSAEFPEHAARIAAYRTRWDEMLSGPIHDSVAILHELRARGVRLYALTNWSNETFPLAFGDVQRFGRERSRAFTTAKPSDEIDHLSSSSIGHWHQVSAVRRSTGCRDVIGPVPQSLWMI